MDFRIRPKVHLPTRVVKALRQRPRSIKGLACVERFAGRGPRFLELAPAHMTARSAWQRVRAFQRRDLDSRPEPSPTLGPRRPASETRRIPEVARTGQDEHLHSTLQGPDFREDPIPVAAPP